MIILRTPDDMRWLAETHRVDVDGYVVAILHGTEDSPYNVELYARDHFECRPTAWVETADGDLRLESLGEKPSKSLFGIED